MGALSWITIEGFKSIKGIEQLPLRQINVLIGANGSGKSNFLQAFSFLSAIRSGGLRSYVFKAGGADRVLHFGAKHTNALRIHISFADGINEYLIQLFPNESDGMSPDGETASFRRPSGQPYICYLWPRKGEAGISHTKNKERVVEYVKNHLNCWRLYHFHDTSATSLMKKTGDLHDNRYLRPDGSNLASFLYLLGQKHEQSYGHICHAIEQVAPFFEDFQLAPQELNPDKIRLEWKHQGSDAYFDASSLSDGTLRFMALATLFLQPPGLRPKLIIIDEPELGLHPSAIQILASLVKAAAVETQIILATQSPLLLDHFNPEDVIVANRLAGATELTRLEPEALKGWLEDYKLGQLWETNTFGGRPMPEDMGPANLW